MKSSGKPGYTSNIRPRGEEENFDIQKFLSVFIVYWPFFATCAVSAILIAFLYLRYSTPQYKISAKILVKDEQKGGNNIDGSMVLQEMGIMSSKSNVDNETEIIKSRTMMESVARSLKLNVQYFSSGRIKEQELYKTSPFLLAPVTENKNTLKVWTYTIETNGKNGFTLSTDEQKWQGHWGDTIALPSGRAVITETRHLDTDPKNEYLIKVVPFDLIVSNYMANLQISIPNKQVSTIAMNLQESTPGKGEDILNKLIDVYLQANVDDKNSIANSTMEFIDERLAIVSRELTGIEKDIEYFKTTNELTDITEQSKQLLSNTSDYVHQLTQQEVQLNIVNALEDYLKDNATNKRLIPSSLILQNTSFTDIVQNYNKLQLDRERLLMTNTESNPMVRTLDQQMEGLRSDLNNSLSSLKRELQINVKELRGRTGMLDAQIRKVPSKERIFLEYSRQQNIKQELYLFLLKKREETAISKSSTLANARIVDPAKSESKPFKPKKPLIMLSALMMGLVIPAGIIYLRGMLNTRIMKKDDIINFTHIPILGEVGHNPQGSNIMQSQRGSRDTMSEQFRALRTNIQFLQTTPDEKVILVTSSMSGEGKSFIAMNLARIIGLSGKRVLLMEMDLRKPKISKSLGYDNSIGFSNYAIGAIGYEDLILPSAHSIRQSMIIENFYMVPSGPIPPNPAELIILDRTEELFRKLREDFDHIIIDSPPIGSVTDAQLLSKYADITLYVVRRGYTYKNQLYIPHDIAINNRMPKMNIVVNDVKMQSGYGYGYGYGYGSYGEAEEQQDNIFKRIFKQTKK